MRIWTDEVQYSDTTYYVLINAHVDVQEKYQPDGLSGFAQTFTLRFIGQSKLPNRQPELVNFKPELTVEAGFAQQLYIGRISDADNDPVEVEWSFISAKIDYIERSLSNVEEDFYLFVDPPTDEIERVIQIQIRLTDTHLEDEDDENSVVHSERIYKLNINVDLIGQYEFNGEFVSGLDENEEDQEQ